MRLSICTPSKGFSLIELMVALVIASILAAIAYPAYTSQMQRGRRADAIAALTTVMQAQERYRSNVSNYASSVTTDLGLDISKVTPHYRVALSAVGNPPGFSTGYIATATPTTGGKQAGDLACKSFVVKLEGAMPTYEATGDPNNTGTDSNTTAICWPR